MTILAIFVRKAKLIGRRRTTTCLMTKGKRRFFKNENTRKLLPKSKLSLQKHPPVDYKQRNFSQIPPSESKRQMQRSPLPKEGIVSRRKHATAATVLRTPAR